MRVLKQKSFVTSIGKLAKSELNIAIKSTRGEVHLQTRCISSTCRH